MEQRNLDLGLPVSSDQWGQLRRTAQAVRANGYLWSGDEPDRIRILLRDEESRGLWDRLVSDENRYGAHEVEVAQVVYNDGRPFAQLEAHPAFDEPSVTDGQETALEEGQAHFVRQKWHELLERSGIHFTPGHVPTDVR